MKEDSYGLVYQKMHPVLLQNNPIFKTTGFSRLFWLSGNLHLLIDLIKTNYLMYFLCWLGENKITNFEGQLWSRWSRCDVCSVLGVLAMLIGVFCKSGPENKILHLVLSDESWPFLGKGCVHKQLLFLNISCVKDCITHEERGKTRHFFLAEGIATNVGHFLSWFGEKKDAQFIAPRPSHMFQT